MNDIVFEIPIPSDDDGYVLFRCPKCGEYFKLSPSDYNSDEVIEIHCPQCGLVSENYLTEDVIELGLAMVENYAMDEIYNAFKELEKQTKNSFLKIKANKPKKKEEISIKSTIDAMEICEFSCCEKTAKLRSILIYCGSYCPFCGGKQDGNN